MPDPNGLATFLRSRRDLVKPADIGLPESDRRRVSGLRREEVAMLAGISTEYYLRLEQGRETQPSDQVLESLARALQLDDDAVQYMRNTARPAPRRRTRLTADRLDPGISTLINTWPLTPAYVHGRRMTILAANPLAQAMVPYFAPQVNILRAVFLEPKLRDWVGNWDEVTSVLVSWARFLLAEDSNKDPEMHSLVGELSLASPRFRTLWARQDVKQKSSGPALFDHPQVGRLVLQYQTFVLPNSQQMLATYIAEPGSASEDALRLLSSLTQPSAPSA
jgi:transcriptional regulator with XRE-family HTH domain